MSAVIVVGVAGSALLVLGHRGRGAAASRPTTLTASAAALSAPSAV